MIHNSRSFLFVLVRMIRSSCIFIKSLNQINLITSSKVINYTLSVTQVQVLIVYDSDLRQSVELCMSVVFKRP
jgi:hypothetical protein